jgi:hypothetical protein
VDDAVNVVDAVDAVEASDAMVLGRESGKKKLWEKIKTLCNTTSGYKPK